MDDRHGRNNGDTAPSQESGGNPDALQSEESQPSCRSSSSSTATEQDSSHLSDSTYGEEEASSTERTEKMPSHRQNPEYKHRAEAPNHPHNTSGAGLVHDLLVPRTQLLSRERSEYGEYELHQVDHRRSTIAQLRAAAQSQSSSFGTTDNTERYHHSSDNDEIVQEKVGRRKRKRSETKGKQAERWDQMFGRLVEFKRIHGHCLVPNRYPHDPSLGAWVSTQRHHYKIMRSGERDMTTPMTPERAARLAALGFAWATSDPRHVPWETRFQQLLEYKAVHGTLLEYELHTS